MRSARILCLLAAVVVTSMPVFAADETTRATPPRPLQAATDAPLAPMSLAAIFAAAQVVEDAGIVKEPGMIVGAPSVEVLVARIENGKVVMSCVSSEAAAKRFLTAARDHVAEVAKEQ